MVFTNVFHWWSRPEVSGARKSVAFEPPGPCFVLFEWSVSAETWLLKDVERKVEPLWTTQRNMIETFNETFNETVIWKNGWKGKSWRWKQGNIHMKTHINAHSHWNSSGKGMNVDNVAPEMLISGLDIQAAFCACQGPRASVFSLLWRVWRYCSISDISHIIRVRCCQFMLHAPWSQWLSNDCPCWLSVAIERCHKKSRKTSKDPGSAGLYLISGCCPTSGRGEDLIFFELRRSEQFEQIQNDQICPVWISAFRETRSQCLHRPSGHREASQEIQLGTWSSVRNVKWKMNKNDAFKFIYSFYSTFRLFRVSSTFHLSIARGYLGMRTYIKYQQVYWQMTWDIQRCTLLYMNRCTTTCSMICSAIEVGSQSLQQRLALPGSRLLLRGTAMTFGAKTGSPSDSFSYDFIWFHMISWSESRRNHMNSSIYIYISISYQYHWI